MDRWLHVTGLDDTMGIVPLGQIMYIDEGYDHGGAMIHLNMQDGKLAVKETLEDIIEIINGWA